MSDLVRLIQGSKCDSAFNENSVESCELQAGAEVSFKFLNKRTLQSGFAIVNSNGIIQEISWVLEVHGQDTWKVI